MSGHNRGRITKKDSAVAQAGRQGGRTLAFKKGPGVPAKRGKRKAWYEGSPKAVMSGGKEVWVSRKYSSR